MRGESGAPGNTGSAERTQIPTIERRGSGRAGLYATVAVAIVVVLLFVVGFQTSWFGTQKKSTPGTTAGSCPTGQTIAGAGAQAALALLSTWTQGYQTFSANTLNYNPSGSGSGLTAFTARTVDFAVTDDPLNTSQTSALPTPALTLPIAGTAIPIIYNLPGLTKPVQLTGAILAAIYLGTITNWNDTAISSINPGLTLPNHVIVTVHRSDVAGSTYVFTNLLKDDSTAWAAGPGWSTGISWPKAPTQAGIKGNSALLSYVASNPYTVGYSDLSDVLANPGLQYARIQDPAGNFVLPNLANTAAAIANLSQSTTFPTASGNWDGVSMVNSPGTFDYPLATFIYLFVYQKADLGFSPSLAKTQALLQFLNWTVGPGQLDAPALYYANLPPVVLTNDRGGLATITYNGGAVPACG